MLREDNNNWEDMAEIINSLTFPPIFASVYFISLYIN